MPRRAKLARSGGYLNRNINNKTHCRCFKCWRRQVKTMHPDQYLRRPRCQFCTTKCKKHKYASANCSKCNVVYLRVDTYMQNRVLVTCYSCDGYHFPHRQGSKQCCYRKDGSRRVRGDADFYDPQEERYAESVNRAQWPAS